MRRAAAVITVSDRAHTGARADGSGPIAVGLLRDAGFECGDPVIVPDGAESVATALRAAVAAGADLVVTTGGTGVSPRDRTPEGTAQVVERLLPGISEELRRRGAADHVTALLSRGLSGVTARTLIVNLPGSPGAVETGVPLVTSLARHVLDQLEGGDHS